jgi:protein gp37
VAQKTPIEWTETTWNPLTGCTKISPGASGATRSVFKAPEGDGQKNYRNAFKLTLHEHMLDAPLRWRKPQMIFVNSMSDLFQDQVPLEFIRQAFDTMRAAIGISSRF